MSNRAFTLIEVLIVVLIIAILAAIALPKYQFSVGKTKYTLLVHETMQIKSAFERAYMTKGSYPFKMEDLDITIPGEIKKNYVDLQEFLTSDGIYLKIRKNNCIEAYYPSWQEGDFESNPWMGIKFFVEFDRASNFDYSCNNVHSIGPNPRGYCYTNATNLPGNQGSKLCAAVTNEPIKTTGYTQFYPF